MKQDESSTKTKWICRNFVVVVFYYFIIWIKNVLREAGIDTKIFKGHSTCSASTSKAGLAGLFLTDILERGSWANASTWQRFYNRQVESSAEKYQNKVLS